MPVHVVKTFLLIKECPINLECRLIKTVDFPRHDIFVGGIVETYSRVAGGEPAESALPFDSICDTMLTS